MAETVFCKSLGNIVSFLLSDIANMFFDVEDIRASDSEMSAAVLNETLTQLQEFFIVCFDFIFIVILFRLMEKQLFILTVRILILESRK